MLMANAAAVQMAAVDFYEALVKVSQVAAHPRGTTRDLGAHSLAGMRRRA